MAKKGIDVSRWQGAINWNDAKPDFCIIQAGFGRETSQKDVQFEANYAGCKRAGVPCGAYWYNYAQSPEDAVREANACLAVIKGKQFEYPIYYDIEENSVLKLGRDKVSAIAKAFLETIEKAGYFVGLYMAASHLNSYINDDIKKKYSIWVAHIDTSKPAYSGNYGMWQYSWKGRINGIAGDVDMDYAYEDFPTIIKKAGLNGFPKQTTTNTTPAATPAVELTQTKTGTLTLKGTFKVDGKEYPITIENLEIKSK